jgi:type I restriction enzyme S subunit
MKWEKVKLEDIVKLTKGKKHSEVDDTNAYRYLQIEDLHGSGTDKYTNEDGVLCDPSDLLIAWDGANAGKVGTGLHGMAGSTLARISVTADNVSSKYLYWYLSSNFEVIKSKRTGATIPHVNGSELRSMMVPLPPLHIQEKIADTLNKADALRRKDRELLQKYDELAQAIFYDMFGNETTFESATKVLKILGGAAFKSSDFSETGIPLIRIGSINKGYFDKNQLVYLPNEFLKDNNKYVIAPGDLLITLTGTVGKDDYGNPFLLGSEHSKYFLNQRVAKIIFDKEKYTPEYLFYFFKQKSTREKLTGISRGVRQANISNQDIYDLIIPTPSINKQKQFSDVLRLKKKSQHLLDQSINMGLFTVSLSRFFS